LVCTFILSSRLAIFSPASSCVLLKPNLISTVLIVEMKHAICNTSVPKHDSDNIAHFSLLFSHFPLPSPKARDVKGCWRAAG